MDYVNLSDKPKKRPSGRTAKAHMKDEIVAFVKELEADPSFPLVFYWAVVHHFRERTHSTRRILRYVTELVNEGRLYRNDVYNVNPLLSTKEFK